MSGRIRTVKPEWLEDELLAAASDEARVLSIGLILMADDYGNGRASEAEIAMAVWRYEMCRDGGTRAPETLAKASRALRELLGIRFIGTWTVSGQTYFAIRKWNEHQKVDHKGKPRVPAAPKELFHEESGDSRDSRETDARPSRESRETLAPDPDLRPPTTTTISTTRGSVDPPPPVAPTKPSPEPPAPEPVKAPVPVERVRTLAPLVSANSLSRDGEVVRKAMERVCARAKRLPPTETRDLDGQPWIELGQTCREILGLEGGTLDSVAETLFTRWLNTPRTKSKGHPLSWLVRSPDEYWRRTSTEPVLGGGETTDELIADLQRTRAT